MFLKFSQYQKPSLNLSKSYFCRILHDPVLLFCISLCFSFKTLGDMSKETKIKRKSRLEEGFPFLGAGLDILNRFEKSWFLLHKRTKACTQIAESVDGDIVMLSAHWERRKAALTHLQEQLQSLPDFITELDAITANIAQLEGEFAEMESRLLHLETLCCQCEQQTVKNHHMSQLEDYKKKKRKEADLLEAELKCEHAQRVAEMELVMQQKLRERQKVYEEAFNEDVEKYLSTGCLQGKESAGVDVAVLDQMTFINLSDLEALDDFLNSTGEDSSCGSSLTSGPDLNSSSLESLNQVPPINSSQSDRAAEWQQEEPLVQSDEEDVQADMSLAAVQDVGTVWDSDESDGADPLMEKPQN
uniref:Dystrobrevin binding protein 1b n=1 Tax=Poecilia mexicana TaxID=48701 RepID=A0A3B3WG43_9TELE